MILYLMVALVCFVIVMMAWGWNATAEEGQGFWEHLSAAAMHSLTVAWAYLLIVLGSGAGILEQVAPVIGSTDIQQMIQGAIKPEHWPYWMAAIGVITLLARLRSIGSDR